MAVVVCVAGRVLREIEAVDGLGEQVEVVSQAVFFCGAKALVQQQRQRVDEYIVHDGAPSRCGPRKGRVDNACPAACPAHGQRMACSTTVSCAIIVLSESPLPDDASAGKQHVDKVVDCNGDLAVDGYDGSCCGNGVRL